MTTPEVNIRKLRHEDLVKYHKLSDDEVWNVGMDVYEKMFEISPDGFYCAENKETKEVVSFCGGVDIGDKRAVIVSFITEPKLRGQGIGSKVIKKILEHYEGYEMIVNSAVGREPMYERFGMAKFLYQTNQLICRPKPLEKQAINFNIFPLENIEDIYPLDKAITGSDRKQILKWFFETSDKSFFSKNEQGEIEGYTMVRKTPLGISLSPCYARSEAALRGLIEKVISIYPNSDAQICLPIDNKNSLKILEEYFHVKISTCCFPKDAPEDLTVSLPNTWLGSKQDLKFEKSSVISILDFHFGVC